MHRMTSLLWILRSHAYPASIYLLKIPDNFPDNLREFITDTVPADTGLIIRDMRNSTEADIRWCRRFSPVLVVDDRGPGRICADFSLDLLPHYDSHNSIESILRSFIYGYSFTQDVNSIQTKVIEKSLDIVIYIGSDPEKSLIEKMVSLIPPDTKTLLLSSRGPQKIVDGALVAEPTHNYAEILMAAKLLITHFGITLFEGFLTRCRLFTINPSDYHSRLTEHIRDSLQICDLGTLDTINYDDARYAISTSIQDSLGIIVSPNEIKQSIAQCHNNLIEHLQSSVLSHLP